MSEFFEMLKNSKFIVMEKSLYDKIIPLDENAFKEFQKWQKEHIHKKLKKGGGE